MKARIALLFGGGGSEHDVSVMGYEYVKELLHDTDYEILPVYINKNGEWLIENMRGSPACLSKNLRGSLYTDNCFIKIDAAIPLLHGDGGEDGSVQGALDVAGIAYVGADVCTSAISIDKVYTKSIVESLGISVVDYVPFSKNTDAYKALKICKDRLSFPMFVKPRRLGSSVGAYPVYNDEEFLKLFPVSMKLGNGLVIVEKMLTDKRELECAFFEADKKRVITEPGEILVQGFYGYDEKYSGKTVVMPRADIDHDHAFKIREYAEKIADVLSLRHLGRIDFFLADGCVYFNEVNTFPGFTKESLYPKMLEAAGISPRDALLSFIKDALKC